MLGSSELSRALDPNHYQRERQCQVNASPTYDQHARIPASSSENIQQHQPFTPHRSELAGAINPAAASPSTSSRSSPRKQPRQPSTNPIRLLKGLIQSIATYKAAVDQEKKRRLTWEQEKEAKYITRQVELEKRVAELEQELEILKAQYGISQEQVSQYAQESIQNTPQYPSLSPGESVLLFDPSDNDTDSLELAEGSTSESILQKRARTGSSDNSSKDGSAKLRTQRSSRSQTLQAAMRNHILLSMCFENDVELPPSHDESITLLPTQPVRFVWSKTTKKSPHNARMKTRIISNLIANKDLYPLVPVQEFTEAKLDGTFEQAFTTLRQKFASQRGLKADSKYRADMKARRARRMSRKKIKLANRLATRKELEPYNNSVFDFAFQLECMSSEESSEEDADTAGEDKPAGRSLRIRWLAWRSARLQQLFRIIDEHEQNNRGTKPKRGVGRKDRHLGPPKDGNPPPPRGTPQWMVSKKWLQQATAVRPQVSSLVTPSDERAAQAVAVLADESEDEQEAPQPPDYSQMPVTEFPLLQPMPPITAAADAYQHAHYVYAQQAWAYPMTGYVDPSQFSSPILQTYPSGSQHSS